MRIVVTGKTGQVATALRERGPSFGADVMVIGRPEFDLLDPTRIQAGLAALRPDVIVSAAAFTAVDRAESEADAAFAINGQGAAAVAEAAKALCVPVVHLSTDYVFNGRSDIAWTENDPVDPLSVYGASKLAGEKAVLASGARAVVLRIAWVYAPFGANFVRTMLRVGESETKLRVVADQIGAPTSALDVADGVLQVAGNLVARSSDRRLTGVFHMGPAGSDASWADFAEAIFAGSARRGGPHAEIVRIPTSAYPTAASRPRQSRLNSEKLAATHGVRLPDWRLSLEAVLDRLVGPTSPNVGTQKT